MTEIPRHSDNGIESSETGVTPAKEHLQRFLRWIFGWSTVLTHENRHGAHADYVWPPSMANLLRRLQLAQGGLYAVSGLQGCGKSAAFDALREELMRNGVIALKWPTSRNWRQEILQDPGTGWETGLGRAYSKLLVYEVRQQLRKNPTLAKRIGLEGETDDYSGIDIEPKLKDIAIRTLPGWKRAQLLDEAIREELGNVANVLVDMPDYARKDARLITRDLSLFQDFWALMPTYWRAPNMVVFFQRELFNAPRQHFFLRKMLQIELEPFKAEQLVEAYKRQIKKAQALEKKECSPTYPFDEKALFELAHMSRGIFRRFLRYVQMCLERLLAADEDAALPLTVDFVRSAVPAGQIVQDMALELTEILPKAEHRYLAVRILESARQHPGMSQVELSKKLEVDDVALSRILSKLESSGYIKRERGLGAEKRVLVQSTLDALG